MIEGDRAADAIALDAESLAPAVTRAAAILDLLAGDGAVAYGPSEIARRLGLPKSSIANICGTLADVGLLRRVGTGFALGRKLAELGGAYLAAMDLVQEFYEACRELPTGSEETVQLAVLDGLEMTYLARHDGRQPVRLTSQIGRRLPALLRAAGLDAVTAAGSAGIDGIGQPYQRLLLTFAARFRDRLLNGITTAGELDRLVDAVGAHLARPDTVVVRAMTVQAWGRVAGTGVVGR